MAIDYSFGGNVSAAQAHDQRHIPKFIGEIWTVDGTNGNDNNDGTGPHEALATVSAAIAAAGAGDAIQVKAGTYDCGGIDLNKQALELWCELGVILTNTSGGAIVTMSANYTLVRGLRAMQAGQVGFHITGSRCVLEDCRGGPGVSVGFDIDGGSALLRDCFVGQASVTGFDIGANGAKLIDCHATGSGGATRGFYVSAGQRDYLLHCTSVGNATAGFEIVAGSNEFTIYDCASGGGDGDRIDSGERNFWPGFADRMRREHHEHIYPMGAGEGVAHDPVTVDNTTTNDAGGTREDQNYWGDVVRMIPPDTLTDMWFSLGLYIYANTASDIQQWQAFFTNDTYKTTQNGGNDWDAGETALTVVDGSVTQANDLVWITGADRADGEILEVVSVVGNVVTVASETRASAGVGLRYDYDLGGGGQTMYVIYRPADRALHGFDGDFSAGSAKDFARISWYASRLIQPNGAMLMRMLNASDGLASSFSARTIYED